MEEKKLTDEEIARAILQQVEYNAGIPYINEWKQVKTVKFTEILDFIHRLQDENEQLTEEKEEIRLFNLAIENGEIDMRIESEMAKSFYNSIVQIFEQNGAKNFFTTTVDIQGKKGRYAFTIEKVGGQTVAEKLGELQKQVDELKEERNKNYLKGEIIMKDKKTLLDEIKKQCGDCEAWSGTDCTRNPYAQGCLKDEKQVIECHGMLKGCDMVQQAVKDTAKEILDEVSKHFGGKWLVELYKKYGLEWSVGVE